MLVWVSLQASLHSSLQYCVGVLHLGVEKWHWASESASDVPWAECYATLPWRWASESASEVPSCECYTSLLWFGQVSLPVTCQAANVTQPDRLTWSCEHSGHVLRHHVGVTTLERPDPKGLSTFGRCSEFLPRRGSIWTDIFQIWG
jgi:hypothetical protein